MPCSWISLRSTTRIPTTWPWCCASPSFTSRKTTSRERCPTTTGPTNSPRAAIPAWCAKLSELNLKNIDGQIETRETWLAEHAASVNGSEVDEETQATVAQVEQDLAGYRAQKQETQIAAARERVERNPTDLTFRFELGEQLVKAGQHSEAVAELQKAQNSPSLGVRAKYLLGQCFEVKNITNLAVKQYEDAKSKLPAMDGMKKDIVYRLGLLHEKMGDKEKYLANMTEIYEVDSAYQDVAARVEGGYA